MHLRMIGVWLLIAACSCVANVQVPDETRAWTAERVQIESDFEALLGLYIKLDPYDGFREAGTDIPELMDRQSAETRRVMAMMEQYFVASGGDMEVFGWMTVRHAELFLASGCGLITGSTVEGLDQELASQYEKRLMGQAISMIEASRRLLVVAEEKASEDWSLRASAKLAELRSFEESALVVCERTCEYWAPEYFCVDGSRTLIVSSLDKNT